MDLNTTLDPKSYQILIAAFLPIPISLLKQAVAKFSLPGEVIYGVAILISILVGLGGALVQGYSFNDAGVMWNSILVTITISQTSYHLLLKRLEPIIDKKE